MTPTASATATQNPEQTITFGTLTAKTYGDAPFTVSATTSSGLPVEFVASAPCSISSGVVTLLGAGTCTITASQPGNATYHPAPSVTQSLEIAKAPLTVTASAASREYGAQNPVFTPLYGGFVAGEDASVLTGVPSLTTAATATDPVSGSPYAIAVSQGTLSAANYGFAFVSGTLTVTKAATALVVGNARGTYSTTANLSATLTRGTTPLAGQTIRLKLNGRTVCGDPGQTTCPVTDGSGVATLSGASLTGTTGGWIDVGTYAYGGTTSGARAEFDGDTNHLATTGGGTLTVLQARTDIDWERPAAIAYGQTLGAQDLDARAFFNGVTVSGTYRYVADSDVLTTCTTIGCTSSVLVSAGHHTLSVDFFSDSPNYSDNTKAHTSYSVDKGDQAITLGALAAKTYGDVPFTVSATASSGLAVTLDVGRRDPCTVSQSTITLTGAGTCTVTASQGGDGNYNAATDVSRSFTIGQAAATVTLSNLSQTYAGSARPVTVTTNPTGLSTSVTYTGTNGTTYAASTTAPTNAGTYTATATITDANYQGSATATLTIAKATATITLDSASLSQTYDGSARSVTATTSPRNLTYSITYTGTSVSYGPSTTAPANAGSYSVVATISDANYQGTSAPGALTVAQASQSVSFSNITNKRLSRDPNPFTISATVTSQLQVAFAASGQCTVSGATLSSGTTSASVTMTGTGSCTIVASQAGNANYAAASSVTRSFTISS